MAKTRRDASGVRPTQAKAVAERPRRGKGGQQAAELAREQFLHLRRTEKLTTKEACRRIGYAHGAYYYWRKIDPEFAEKDDRVMGRRFQEDVAGGGRPQVPPFEEFCEVYLGFRLFWHQLQWVDVLEGREPRDLHPRQTYTPGSDPHLLLVNTPPGFAKSTTITAAYMLWRLLKDPNTQAVIVSKNEVMAKKWMYQIQDWLTSRTYAKLQDDFGPEGGFYSTSPIWTKTQIYFGSELRDRNAKDPTLEVLGMGGTIYGARADLIILDDIVDTKNAHDFDNQIEWLTGMVLTRPADEDKVLIIGTRVSPIDLYKELMDPKRYEDSEPPWTYFAQPAVLEYADTPADWVTLWPRSNMPKKGQTVVADADGLYPKWDGASLARMRKRISTDPHAWALKYQQEDVDEATTFPREDVYGCVNGHRKTGKLAPGVVGVPPEGMDGKYVIAGLDPAAAGHTAAVVIALDRSSGKRYVLNVANRPGLSPDGMRSLIKVYTEEYNVREWRIERNAFQSFLTQDREVNKYLANRGVVLHEHTTGRNKMDPDLGVASMSGLFKGWRDRNNLIDLPNTQTAGVQDLCDQLTSWFPETKGKTDCVMAMWFAEIRCRELTDDLDGGATYMQSDWLSDDQLASQVLIDVYDYENAAPDDQLTSWWA